MHKQNILSCLRRNFNSDMPHSCRRILFHRLMVFNSGMKSNKRMDYFNRKKKKK